MSTGRQKYNNKIKSHYIVTQAQVYFPQISGCNLNSVFSYMIL